MHYSKILSSSVVMFMVFSLTFFTPTSFAKINADDSNEIARRGDGGGRGGGGRGGGRGGGYHRGGGKRDGGHHRYHRGGRHLYYSPFYRDRYDPFYNESQYYCDEEGNCYYYEPQGGSGFSIQFGL